MDSLTTVKNLSSQSVLNGNSKAEQNNSCPAEQDVFIKTDMGKTAAISTFQ